MQVPQFLLEAGYGHRGFDERAGAVAVTQPRRVAAISTAQRVAAELGSEIGDTVGYQVGAACWRAAACRRSCMATWQRRAPPQAPCAGHICRPGGSMCANVPRECCVPFRATALAAAWHCGH